ncbi:MAG: hypothetical protein COA47_03110 [Robiginitomaculum sp.]|nr:MAG: hypothetical protein COA47_03110 [Robiginitomaculum sp.]
MRHPDEQLSAYLDGELDKKERQKLETALASDPDLAERLAALEHTNAVLKATFNPILEEPVPEHVLALLSDAKQPTDSGDVVPLFPQKVHLQFSKWQLPIAASIALVLGVGIGHNWSPGIELGGTLMAQVSGTIAPGNPLFDVLEHTPSAHQVSLVADGSVQARPVLSYQTNDGTYCREFEVKGPKAGLHGIACRSGQNWDIQIQNQTRLQASSGMRTASGNTDQAVDQFISDSISDIPFGLEREVELMQNGWSQ